LELKLNPKTEIGIFVHPFGDGGNERNMINLAGEFARRGLVVDLVVDRLKGPLGKLISPDVRVVELKTGQSAETVKALVNYFNQSRPEIFHTVKGFGREALRARKACDNNPRVSLMVGTTMSQKVKFMNPFKRLMTIREMRKICPVIDFIIAVSKGVAKDVAALTGLQLDRISLVPLPVITREFIRLSAEPIAHPWLADKVTPVMVGAGRLGRAKDFSTLLRAFAIVRQQRPVKLLILGDGRKRNELERLAHTLNIRNDVHLPGFVINPYAYLSRADLFVLSSLWEGMPNVLIEALALGIPVASTDCCSGAREILQDGLLGHLVPIGDHNALAQAISCTLDRPIEAKALKQAAAAYTVESSAEQHLKIFRMENH
jgi:glycosyltransferase involved in cell wall biosynthesis